ncbi:phage antirepressor N-terminal domain-containing protein [Methylobacterium sp. NMS14P]|uniref:phage antirepressor N-terminal domain-containing protein n=1 Tax=Methylobacterium sp. NMS14P TaxID=2894310 RepID=UPI003FD58FFD
MRPVVVGMGLDRGGQRAKFNADLDRYGVRNDTIMRDGSGREQAMSCIPLRRSPMWLATISPARIFCRRIALFALLPIAAVQLRTAPARERAGCRACLVHGGRRVSSPSTTLGNPDSLPGDVGLTRLRHHAVGPRRVSARPLVRSDAPPPCEQIGAGPSGRCSGGTYDGRARPKAI